MANSALQDDGHIDCGEAKSKASFDRNPHLNMIVTVADQKYQCHVSSPRAIHDVGQKRKLDASMHGVQIS
ncbi:MAG: hypothetical protein ACLTYH_00755 [Streptococcus salivarius]